MTTPMHRKKRNEIALSLLTFHRQRRGPEGAPSDQWLAWMAWHKAWDDLIVRFHSGGRNARGHGWRNVKYLSPEYPTRYRDGNSGNEFDTR